MKGIILAGGNATRLRPLTSVTSKQLLPVYDKPMIFYPLQTLIDAHIDDILIIVAPEYAGHFVRLLGDGTDLGVKINYAIQPVPRGLSDAFIIGKDFIGTGDVAMILGDNIFLGDLSEQIKEFDGGGMIFAKSVKDPERFGVVEVEGGKAVSIEEKPENPKSDLAIVGLYVFDNKVTTYAENLKPSARGELEITDIHKMYMINDKLKVQKVKCDWFDAGTFDSLIEVSNKIKEQRE